MALLCASLHAAQGDASGIAEREARLSAQLRCLVCQNQSLAESNAPLAADMRRQIREQLGQGRSDTEVIAFFERRYGAFVRYEPPFRPATWLLWLGPFLLLAIGLLALWRVVRARRDAEADAPLTPEERRRAAAWLEGNGR
ncbi:cytochrome c-type biogenesis protein [Ramlibacter tataouinensis]